MIGVPEIADLPQTAQNGPFSLSFSINALWWISGF